MPALQIDMAIFPPSLPDFLSEMVHQHLSNDFGALVKAVLSGEALLDLRVLPQRRRCQTASERPSAQT